MTVKELIEKLKEVPQDAEVDIQIDLYDMKFIGSSDIVVVMELGRLVTIQSKQ